MEDHSPIIRGYLDYPLMAHRIESEWNTSILSAIRLMLRAKHGSTGVDTALWIQQCRYSSVVSEA